MAPLRASLNLVSKCFKQVSDFQIEIVQFSDSSRLQQYFGGYEATTCVMTGLSAAFFSERAGLLWCRDARVGHGGLSCYGSMAGVAV